MKTKIIFYFPYYEECGVPVLFTRMSRWLAEHYGDEYDVFVGDYKDGAMARNLIKGDKVRLCESGTSDGIFVKNGDILIMQTFNPSYWPSELHIEPKARIFFWTLHYRNLTLSLLPLPGLRELPFNHLWIYKTCTIFYSSMLKRLRMLIEMMMQHNAHYFMDISTEKQTLLHLPINKCLCKDYLPVPASDYNGVLKHKGTGDVLNLCWLGRVENEKTRPLVYTMLKCSEYAKRNRILIKFIIIGYGDDTSYVDNLSINNDYFTKTKCHTVKFAELDSYLLNNVDFMFAMGTSALEAAKLGIPTVLLDCTTKDMKEGYKYRFLYERVGYDLTHFMDEDDFEEGNNSFELIMESVINSYDEVSEKCRNHFVDKHSLTSVGNKFYEIINKMSFTFDMIDPKTIQQPAILNIYNRLRGLK